MRKLYGVATRNAVRSNEHKHSFFGDGRTAWITVCSLDSKTSNEELERKNNTCMYFQEHGLSVLLARTGDAVCFACCAFASLVGCWETITHLETLGSALSLEDPVWTSHFPMWNSLHQQWSEEKQSELIYVTIHRAALHKKEAHKCSTHFSTQLRNETLLVNSLTNTNK